MVDLPVGSSGFGRAFGEQVSVALGLNGDLNDGLAQYPKLAAVLGADGNRNRGDLNGQRVDLHLGEIGLGAEQNG